MALSDEDKRWMEAQLERVKTRLLTESISGHLQLKHGNELTQPELRAIDMEMESLSDRIGGLEKGRI